LPRAWLRHACRSQQRKLMSATTDGMEEIVKEFLAESAEGLDLLDRDLVELERDPTSRERLAEIFRAVHTIKGSSGMLGYSKLESVAHAGECLLGQLRDGKLALNPALTSALLAMVDALRGLLNMIERTGSEGSNDCSAVVQLLEDLPGGSSTPRVTVSSGVGRDVGAENPLGEKSAAGTTIRVDVGLIDRMMDLAGELVLARNQTLRFTSLQTDHAILNAAQRLKRITTDMQEAVMKARLQPMGSVWNQFPRLARDLASSGGKQITVEMEGSEIELDRGMIEAIKDPLTHILRNAIDHGIETPEQRARAAKPAVGRLRFCAFHREGRVHVEISDDGAGINPARVRQCALERGLITAEQAAGMGEQQLANLVFAPGFSTAEKVTNVSGRGVGLDVVKINIEKIGGIVDLQSVTGQGTTVHIRIPLTLAILPALIVSSAGQRFAIPQVNVVEVVRLEATSGGMPIEQVCRAPVYRLRERLLPLCFLDRELHLGGKIPSDSYIAVLQAGTGRLGLVVDAVSDTEEIVVKPLGQQLRAISCYAGAAILGDGQVVLILDVAGLAQRTGVVTDARRQPPNLEVATKSGGDWGAQSWLVFWGTAGSRFALPLSAVARLEEIPAERIERSAGREVVQCRGEIMPLLRVSRLFHEPEQDRELLQVAVLHESGVTAGLVLDLIEDIVEETVELRGELRSDLLQGSAVIRERVADVINVKEVLARVTGPPPAEQWPGACKT